MPGGPPEPESSRPLDHDVYCLHCRYNLRGLPGDPVRCPECGQPNPRRELLGQIDAAAERFRDLQAALDIQTVAVLGGLVVAILLLVAAGQVSAVFWAAGSLVVGGAVAGAAALEVRRASVEPGWLRPLALYQACTIAVPALGPALWALCAAVIWCVTAIMGWSTGFGLVPVLGGLVVAVACSIFWQPLERLRRHQEQHFKELIRLTRASSVPEDGDSLRPRAGTASFATAVQHESVYNILVERFATAVAQVAGTPLGHTDPQVRPAGDPRFGDYQCNVAMSLARPLRARPRDIAQRIKDAVEPQLADIAEPLEIAGPGFLNIRLRDEFLAQYLGDIPAPPSEPVAARAEARGSSAQLADRVGLAPVEKPLRVVVEYSQPNIAKQMHVGHLRGTIIGDVFARVLAFEGHEVIRQNHIGDWGTQFGMLIRYYREHPLPTPETHDDVLEAIERDYRAAQERFERDEQFASEARLAVGQLQAGQPDARRVWEQICAVSWQAFTEIYERLDVLLQPSDVRGESFYNDRLAPLVAEVRRKLPPRRPGERSAGPWAEAREDQGAVCVFMYDEQGEPRFKNPDGEPLPMIIQKSDGAFLYATTDLAAIRFRLQDLGADRVIYVTDARQKLHFEMFFEAARAMGWISDQVLVEHVTFGSVLGTDRRPLKTRQGENVKLRELLEEAEKRAYELLQSRDEGGGAGASPARPAAQQPHSRAGEDKTAVPFTQAEKLAIARRVGIASVKYADLCRDRNADYVFSWDTMLAMQGNTAPYMMYAYARIRSIYRKAAERFGCPDVYAAGVTLVLTHPAERALALRLARLREAIDNVAADLTPHTLCGYLYDLASDFMRFYESCPVLAAPDEAARLARTRLCDLTARTLKLGLGLLGIEVIERM